MQSEAYKITGFTAVISALGFLLRWLQIMQIIDPETGLAEPGRAISYVMVAVILIAAAVLAVFCVRMKRFYAPTEPGEALGGKTFAATALTILPAVILAAAGIVRILRANGTAIQLICGAASMAAAYGVAVIASNVKNPDRGGALRLGSILLIVFGGLWLITVYKSAAADPVLWEYAVEVLAVCAALMAFYQVAGYFFGEASPWSSIFFCYFGAFLCVVSTVDEHPLADSLCYAASALLLFVWGFLLTVNIRRSEPAPAEPAEAAE